MRSCAKSAAICCKMLCALWTPRDLSETDAAVSAPVAGSMLPRISSESPEFIRDDDAVSPLNCVAEFTFIVRFRPKIEIGNDPVLVVAANPALIFAPVILTSLGEPIVNDGWEIPVFAFGAEF